MQVIIELNTAEQLTLLQSFVEIGAENHLELLQEDDEFAREALKRRHTAGAAVGLLEAFGCWTAVHKARGDDRLRDGD